MSLEKPTRFNEKHFELLQSILERNNKAGYDFWEYRKSVEALESMDMDEQMRFKSAYATGSTMGATKEGLLKSVDHYTTVLKNEEHKFTSSLQASIQEKVVAREDEIRQINADLQKKKELVEQLSAEIEQLSVRKQKVLEEVKGSSEKIETTKLQFQETLRYMVTEMLSFKEKMEKYLG